MAVKTSPWHLDVVALIVEHLRDKRDLYNCALVNWTFHRAVTPRLYRVLDVQPRVVRSIRSNTTAIVHPARTLLQQPGYAHYVRRINEIATAGDAASTFLPSTIAAFRLCTNLRSFTWTGGGFLSTSPDADLPAYLDTILTHSFPLRELVIRAASPALSPAVWTRLKRLTKLTSLGIWCLEIDHEAFVEWLHRLSPTLQKLELVISPLSDRYMDYLSYLPCLRALCLKAATRCSIPDILALLPTLTSLDVEYYGFSPTARRSFPFHSPSTLYLPSPPSPSPPYRPSPSPPHPHPHPPTATLHTLTITTSSLTRTTSPHRHTELWTWITHLTPHPHTLRSLTVRVFSASPATGENPTGMEMPLAFWEFLSRVHGASLQTLEVEGVVLPVCGCGFSSKAKLERLERLVCALPCGTDMSTFETFLTEQTPNLRELKLTHRSPTSKLEINLECVRRWMTRERSQLRVVEFGETRFTGEWALNTKTGERYFDVKCDSNKSYITWI